MKYTHFINLCNTAVDIQTISLITDTKVNLEPISECELFETLEEAEEFQDKILAMFKDTDSFREMKSKQAEYKAAIYAHSKKKLEILKSYL